MNNTLALTRQVSPAIADCELTYLRRQPIDYPLAQSQHRAYEQALAELGCRVVSLPPEPELPDSVFVEDVALVLDELAVITRPGAASRRPEAESIARALGGYRNLERMSPPATLEGGDVLRVERALYVGVSGRTNPAGIRQLEGWIALYGYTLKPVEVRGCLHLKSAVSQIGPDLLLVNPAWVDPAEFDGLGCLAIDPSEPHAANALLAGEGLIYPASFPRTAELLERHNPKLIRLDVSELQKAEGAVTCCSLIFRE